VQRCDAVRHGRHHTGNDNRVGEYLCDQAHIDRQVHSDEHHTFEVIYGKVNGFQRLSSEHGADTEPNEIETANRLIQRSSAAKMHSKQTQVPIKQVVSASSVDDSDLESLPVNR